MCEIGQPGEIRTHISPPQTVPYARFTIQAEKKNGRDGGIRTPSLAATGGRHSVPSRVDYQVIITPRIKRGLVSPSRRDPPEF
jgi:hypothetical protein